MKTKPTPVRAPDQTTFTWSLPKELKGKLLILAKNEGRPASNWLTWFLLPQVETRLREKNVAVTDEMIEEVLEESAGRSYRGKPGEGKRR